MKKLSFLLVALFTAICVNAQNPVAKIKYEQAEEAFDKNDYTTTLLKLDEVEKLLGSSNPKILYLRIMTQKGLIATNNYEFKVLNEARKNTEVFMKNYEKNEGVEEKFKEVFLFSEELGKLPKTLEEFTWMSEAPKREKAAKEAAAAAYMDNLANQYKFKKGLTEEVFRVYNSFSSELVKKKKYAKDYTAYFRKQGITDMDDNYLYNEGPTGIDIINGIVSGFKYVLKKTSADKNNLYEAVLLFNNFKTQIHNLFPAGQITETEIGGNHAITVNSTGAELVNSIRISLLDPGIFKEKYTINIVQIEFN